MLIHEESITKELRNPFLDRAAAFLNGLIHSASELYWGNSITRAEFEAVLDCARRASTALYAAQSHGWECPPDRSDAVLRCIQDLVPSFHYVRTYKDNGLGSYFFYI